LNFPSEELVLLEPLVLELSEGKIEVFDHVELLPIFDIVVLEVSDAAVVVVFEPSTVNPLLVCWTTESGGWVSVSDVVGSEVVGVMTNAKSPDVSRLLLLAPGAGVVPFVPFPVVLLQLLNVALLVQLLVVLVELTPVELFVELLPVELL